MKGCEIERDTLVVVPRINAKQFMGNGKKAVLVKQSFEGLPLKSWESEN